ncbi:hypothetical protein [Corynebacterium haemomassiliense]|uniref:Uncharacterized protein n=1 Tax=Corynebacterium haemomassiliense TaxID=2754726 RepID=A0A7W2EBX2_9CORY|nr:hypothetical protein [Corynebacterium haemomassiliense]MBA5244906.1 hypothetical protein [Corynebacterium haemomassiliense]
MTQPNYPMIPTKCPYSFRQMDPDQQHSEFAPPGAELPAGWQNSGVITFALAGARTSGKSIYIAMAIKLLEQLTINFGGTFDPADEFTENSFRENYEVPLFGSDESRPRVLSPTAPIDNPDAYQRRPLIYRLGRPKRFNQPNPQQIFVVFRDIAGEDLEARDIRAKSEHLDFLQHADSVIYLYDPLAVSQIRSLVEGLVPTDSRSEASPADVLKNVIEVLGPARPDISLTLAKFDILQEIDRLETGGFAATGSGSTSWPEVMNNLGAAFRRAGSGASRPFDRADSELVHEETRSMLHSLGAQEMFNALEQPLGPPHNYHCHVVSSLGAPPSGDSISDYGIAPFRVLDPMRRVFNNYGLF